VIAAGARAVQRSGRIRNVAIMLARPLSALRSARPGMPFLPRVVVEAICLTEGSIGPARAVARELGLRNRFQLARRLKRAGLPPLHRLAAWATVLSWVLGAERDGLSLSRMACRAGRHPGACYRLVRETTGLGWEGVRTRGSGWVEREFLRELRRAR
jgi:hypothetical protein